MPQVSKNRTGVIKSGSANILASNASSFMSAFSDTTEYDLKSTHEDWPRIQNLYTDEGEILSKIEAEIIDMNDAYQVQRYVSMTMV